MGKLKSIMEITAAEWLKALGLSANELPDVVIVEGSWWRKQRFEWRLGHLQDVRELAFPDIYWGQWGEKKVVYSCPYGAAGTSEIIHIFSVIGVKLAVQIGTCGGLQTHLKPGDIILPKVALCREGVAHLYGAADAVMGSDRWLQQAKTLLTERGHNCYIGPHITWSTIFTETADMVDGWQRAGFLSVDMETATTYAVARYFEVAAVSLLVVWDDLTQGKSFLDPLSEKDKANLDESNQLIFEVALDFSNHLNSNK